LPIYKFSSDWIGRFPYFLSSSTTTNKLTATIQQDIFLLFRLNACSWLVVVNLFYL
jgi:hypothetical protein